MIHGSSASTNTGFDCNENWKAKNSKSHNVKDCERYRKEGWCTKDGDYGPNWKQRWGNFDKYAEKICTWSKCRKGKLPTALSCPQCGCRIGWPSMFTSPLFPICRVGR